MIHIPSCKAPIVKKRPNRAAGYSWRPCPYSPCDFSGRIPDNQKEIHPTTSGYMRLHIRDGHSLTGWICLDNNCPFYKGTASSGITLSVRNTVITSSGTYEVQIINHIIMPCSGTRLFEF